MSKKSSSSAQPADEHGRREDHDPVKAISPVKADEKTELVARAAVSSAIAAARVVSIVDQPSDRTALWGIVASQMKEASDRVNGGDLTEVEAMLVHQAVALQSVFVKLTEGALSAETLSNFDLKFRYALRAQSQCRATLETLANIKNPPMVFARQANVTTGPQQINNGTAAPRAGESLSGQTELSGVAHELRQDCGAPALAGPTDTPLATMGTIDGSADRGGKVAILSERMEGRNARVASHAKPHPA